MLKPGPIDRLLTLRRTGHHLPFQIPLDKLPLPFVRSIIIQAPPPDSQVDRHDPANYSIIDASPATSTTPPLSPPIYTPPPLSGTSQHPFAVSGDQPVAGPSTQPHQPRPAKQRDLPESSDTDQETSAVSLVRSVPYALYRKGADFRAEHHPFDSHAFVNTLIHSGFKEPGARTLMETFRGMLRWRWSQTQANNMSRLTFENEQTLFKAQLTDLRQSLSSTTRKELATLGSAVSAIKREADALGQKIKEDVTLLQHDIEMDVNNRKSDTRSESKGFDIVIEEINNKFTIALSDMRTEIETTKWDLTRKAIVIIVVGIVTIVGGRQYLGGSKNKAKPNPALPSPRPASAMQDMAVGSDDDELFGDEDSAEETEKKLEKLLSDSVVGKVREITKVRPRKTGESQRLGNDNRPKAERI